MLPGEEERLDKLEKLKNKLFSPNFKMKAEHRDSLPHFQDISVPDMWKKEEETAGLGEKIFSHSSFFKKFFVFSIVFFLVASAYAGYVFFSKNNTISNEKIDIAVRSNPFTAGGEEYSLLLEIANGNSAPLDLADLVIEYPKNSDLSGDKERVRLSLGAIPAFSRKTENVKLFFFGEQGSVRRVRIALEYRVEGSNAIFVKERFYDISISSTPVHFILEGPQDIGSSQDIRLNVKAVSNTTKNISDLLIKMEYPLGFQFVSASPSPSFGENVWDLGDLPPGGESSVSITGRMVDVFEGEEKIFRVSGGSESKTEKFAIGTFFDSAEYSTFVEKSAIQAEVLINNISAKEYALDTKSNARVEIKWKNNLDTKINNMEIIAKLSGNALNRKTISSSTGFYDSSKDVIVWNKGVERSLVEVAPGGSGNQHFSFSSLPLFGGQTGSISSPSVEIEISFRGSVQSGGGIITDLGGQQSKIVKIISDVGLSSKVYFGSGPFKNTGEIPPKVEKETTYTVTWSISNTANNLSNAEIHSSLPPWVRFVGVSSPESEELLFNPANGEIVWKPDRVMRNTGIADAGRTVSFQLAFRPSLSQVNTSPVLLKESTLTAYDDFANVEVKVKKPSLTIASLADGQSSRNFGRVTE